MRVALPKGRLLTHLTGFLASKGISVECRNERDYRPSTNYPGFELKLFKPRSIPQLVALGNCDIGFCGHDVVVEAGYDEVEEIFVTNLNKVELVVAAHQSQSNIMKNLPKRPILIATEYENIANRWAMKNHLAHITLLTSGATEVYPPEDADLIIDCVESGRTLEENRLVILEKLFETTTVLIANKMALENKEKWKAIQNFINKISVQ